MVLKKSFSGVLDTPISASYDGISVTVKGMTSENSNSTISYVNEELTTNFLTDLYNTLIEAGYVDTIVNYEDYSITVLGKKVYFFCKKAASKNTLLYLYIYSLGFSTGGQQIVSITNIDTYGYKINIRGDENNICLTVGSNSSYTENDAIYISKCKNIIDSSECIFSCRGFSNSTNYYLIVEKDNPYKSLYSNSTSSPYSINNFTTQINKGKYVCIPMLAKEGTIIIPSMIVGNTGEFTKGNYYKIGEDIYYCNNGYLHKVG